MTPNKRQELERLCDAIQQEQDTDKLIKLLKKLNKVGSDLNRRNTDTIRQPNPHVLKLNRGKVRP